MKIRIRRANINFINFYYYLVILCVVFGSKDTWLGKNDTRIMYMGLLISVLAVIPMVIQRPQMGYDRIKTVVALALIICLSMVFNMDFRGYSLFLNLLAALLVTEYISFKDYYRMFENVIFVFTLVSLALVIVRWIEGTDYLQKYIVIASNEALPWGFRLYGIYREPAMFCIYLGLACARQLFFTDKPKWIKLSVYLLAILLTGSATGYVSITFALICYMKIHGTKFKVSPLLMASIVGMFYLVIRFDVLGYLIKRLSMHGASSYSSNSRYFSIIGGAFVGITHPFFGAGAVKSELRFDEFMNAVGRSAVWANMVTYLWASFGVAFVIIFLKGIYNMAYPRGGMLSVMVLVFIMLLLCGETMTYSSVMWIFMLYGYSNRGKSRAMQISGRKEYAI